MSSIYRLGFGYDGKPYIEVVRVVRETDKMITYVGPFESRARTMVKRGVFFTTFAAAKERAIEITAQIAADAARNLNLARSLAEANGLNGDRMPATCPRNRKT